MTLGCLRVGSGQERGQRGGISGGGEVAFDARCPQELRQPVGAGDEALRFFRHYGLVETVD